MNDHGLPEESPRRRGRSDDDFRVIGGAGQAMPWSDEAEQHILAACLVDGAETIGRCLNEKISEETFYDSKNRMIWACMVELYQRQPPVVIQTLAEELTIRQQFEAIGGFPYLFQFTSKVPTIAHVGYFIDRAKELWIRREMIREATGAIEKLHTFDGT